MSAHGRDRRVLSGAAGTAERHTFVGGVHGSEVPFALGRCAVRLCHGGHRRPASAARPTGTTPGALRALGRERRWYGSEDLWVAEPVLPAVTDGTDGALHIKYASVTLDARGRVTDTKGPPRVSAERADDSRSVRGDTGGFATAHDSVSWWPTVITFSGPGCWTVTETLGSTTVRFTVNVTGG